MDFSFILKILIMAASVTASTIGLDALIVSGDYEPYDWGDYNVLKDAPDTLIYTSPNGYKVPYSEYSKWVNWGEDWFRGQTFGNERIWTDIVGFLNKDIDIPQPGGTWTKESFFKFLLEAIDDLDGVKGNLYDGNGAAYTSNLMIKFPKGSLLDMSIPLPEKFYSGLDVESGSAWPIGVVPVKVNKEEENLPYLMDPGKYSSSVGKRLGNDKYRVGLSCALCHYSLDIDWDGKADLKSARLNEPTPGSQYTPDNSWAIGNQDIALGWVFAMSVNSMAGFPSSGPTLSGNKREPQNWFKFIIDNYKTDPLAVTTMVDRGLMLFPRGFVDDTPDAMHNSLQIPSLYTYKNWPYNYDGVELNSSDRNNNVWTTAFDPSQLISLCRDRGGKLQSFIPDWGKEKDIYRSLTATELASIVAYNSPKALYDPSSRQDIIDDILGISDGVPGMLDTSTIVLLKGIPGVIPSSIFKDPKNKHRIRKPQDYGEDGVYRNRLVGLLGSKVITSDSIINALGVNEISAKYGMNPEQFLSDCVSLMLNWVKPPPNKSSLLENARKKGLVDKGYEVFKSENCVSCHAGPLFTNNMIVPKRKIGTDDLRATKTAGLQTLFTPGYDPKTGEAISGGLIAFLSELIAKVQPGYKVVTLRNIWNTPPYLHDGGVAVAYSNSLGAPPDDLAMLLRTTEDNKVFGTGQILLGMELNPGNYLRANAGLSLQALLLKSERDKVIKANQIPMWQVPGSNEKVSFASIHVQGIGHEFYINDELGGEKITALIAFLLALDDDPRQ